MPHPRLAGRYAKSLIDLSIEKDQLEVVYQDMNYFKSLCKASREFVQLLHSPIIQSEKKKTIIEAVIAANVSELSKLFIILLLNKGRESDLPEVAEAFIEQYNTLKGIHKVKLTTAIAVSKELEDTIVAKIKAAQGIDTIELEKVVDEHIIGGFLLEFNNNLIDASILRDLKDIKKQFSSNLYVHAMH